MSTGNVSKSRRVRGSGSVFQKPGSRTYTIQYYRQGVKMKDGKPVLDASGKPVHARIRVREATGFTSQRKAQDLLNERLTQVSKGTWFEQERRPATVDDLFTALREHYLANGRARSAKGLGWRWSHLEPVFSGTLAANLTTDAITRYTLARQKEGAAYATINRELAALRRAFNFGKRSTPPKVRNVLYIPMLKENNVRKGFVEDADYEKLASHATELWLRTFLELGYTYGWRKRELLGLRVRQINLAHRAIRLDVGTTKNKDGREVAMTAKVAELLRAAIEGKKPDDYVLTRNGKPVRDFRGAWWKLCVAAELGSFTCLECGDPVTTAKCTCGSRKRKYAGLIPHDLRRSAAKALRRAGVPESVIMVAGGWKTPAMFRRYAIVSSADQLAAMQMLEKARQQASNNSPQTAPIPEQQPVLNMEPLSDKVQ